MVLLSRDLRCVEAIQGAGLVISKLLILHRKSTYWDRCRANRSLREQVIHLAFAVVSFIMLFLTVFMMVFFALIEEQVAPVKLAFFVFVGCPVIFTD
jgi:hypothetical protein